LVFLRAAEAAKELQTLVRYLDLQLSPVPAGAAGYRQAGCCL